MHWLPPFGKDSAKVVFESAQGITGVQYSEDCQWLFVTQAVENQRQIVAVDLKDPKNTYVVYQSGKGGAANAKTPMESPFTMPESWHDPEQFPGKKGGAFGAGAGFVPGLMTRPGRGEAKAVRMSSKGEVYVAGTDRAGGAAFPKAYLDRIEVKTGKKTRVFTGKGDVLETIDAVDSDDVKAVFTTRQKKDVVPDSYCTDLATGKDEKLTSNVDPAPWFHQLQVQRFQVTRVDGFKFWVKVTTPAKHEGKLPALFWIYPKEYVDQAAYNNAGGKDGFTAGRFAAPAPRSMALLTLLGYAVVEPDVPIVGPAGRINDNYVPDLRNSLWAVIDELDRRGTIDRDRLAVGGHSYGAFSTANALVHTPFFKAGIAGDGNYNRTLTPMSFQTEKRHLWEARETYLEMSPLLWADRINGALLMYHGMEDANVGTHPTHADHLFQVLRGLGKPVALYMYPYEGHGPIALETTLDQWARWTQWLDRYVKNASRQKTTAAVAQDKQEKKADGKGPKILATTQSSFNQIAPRTGFVRSPDGAALLMGAPVDQSRDEAVQQDATKKLARLFKRDTIDWDKQMLLIAEVGQRKTGGYRVEFTGLDVKDKVLTVKWQLKAPGPDSIVTQVISHPGALALVERFDGEIRFDPPADKLKDQDK
jgi:dipeptidyl aminopeptidase/acylaminoacyl peptidase